MMGIQVRTASGTRLTALYLFRPPESSLIFLSWTPALLPLIDFVHSSPTVAKSIPYFGKSISWAWDNRNALSEPAQWDWLPDLGHSLPGFEDWHGHDGSHYWAASDPLKISNLGNDVLPDLRHHLPGSSIRHVVLIKLESTRQDVFPLKKDGQIWQKLAATWQNGSWPEVVQQRLASLTPSANFLTGDYNEGYGHGHSKHRGGINVRDAHTTSTYTLKSITGTLCGVTPLVADFNVEHEQHIYQPCLPQILSMFNLLKRDNRSTSAGIRYTNHRWRSSFMMSVTNSYDKQDLLMRRLGYKDEDLVTKEYLQSDDAKFGKCTLPEINYYGLQESAVKDYIRDAFRTAEKQNERVFLTHLTSTTHHPFNIPNEEAYVPLVPGDQLKDLSHYLNSVGYVDRWLGRILDILGEQGVSNETLVVVVGDHGLSLPETGAVTPYYQPNVGNFHVPLVFSHPNLPLVNIDSPVNSISILPTILDLLIETGSLPFPQEKAARDLIHNYEGQSLLRPLHAASEQTGQVDWQFTVMNTGRAQVAVRSASSPQWRVVVPVVDDIEWRFTDVKEDPLEKNAVLSFDLETFLRQVKIKHGISAARWVEEAAFMTRWWVNENAKRWRYSQ
ncbi:sulfatase domain protein [Moelleriella libera RCEF 2490]|uniref:Sulfatase domain protein n=1 Tax=Moelleriella libera RCEF 2490 TaxID=1081109 RepID=A0A167Y4G9_9HYPO|nr:sulfatase domain protein [Moelleriella libera RCEF 2490]